MALSVEASLSALPLAEARGLSLPLSRRRALVILTMMALLGAGIFLRLYPSAGYAGLGQDEGSYAIFVKQTQKVGFWNYDAVVQAYVARQYGEAKAGVPATRIGFLAPAVWAANVFHLEPLPALRLISALGSLLLLLATAAIGYRHGGTARMLVLTALMAVAPLQIALAQRALIDGYFACVAVLTAWFFWECLEAPRSRGWLAAYGASLFVLVLTKENAAFVYAALMATGLTLFFVARRRPTIGLIAVSLVCPLLAVLLLAALMGGIGEWVAFYRMFAARSANLRYAILWQDGAWYRYLIDFALLSPCIVALVCGRIFQIERVAKVDVFWALFLGFSFLAMSSIHFGFSLRFAAYWDEPLRWLAASQLILLVYRLFPRRAVPALAVAVALLMAVDLSQYARLFIRGRIYDPVSVHLLRASDLIKF